MKPAKFFLFTLAVISFSACRFTQKETRFQLQPSAHTGITFNNLITESDSLNVMQFEYVYNGAGVGVGDFNNDGLADIFFAGNMVSSQLYLNKGDFKFKEVTTDAGVNTKVWCEGVAIIDINQDGLLDMYISTSHPNIDKSSANLLFVNQGNNANGVPTFKEVASQAGLADMSFSTQAAFLDYDLDGDLDMYLLTNSLETYNRNTLIGQYHGSKKSLDKLFRNDGNTADDLPIFKDVSKEAGIIEEGWGLGVEVADINRDGYPDVYVANDFQSNDLLYINNKNGTFTNRIELYLRHQSHNSMGMDIADFNNDGLEDIAVVDMLPEDNLRQKTMFSRVEYDKFQSSLKKNYQPQYVRNVLQLNNGNNSFSEIGYLAGIQSTDWSWSALFADFDNDGQRDLLISNGYKKDITNMDFVSYRKEATMFGTQKTKEKIILESLKDLDGVRKPKFMFRNNGNYTFSDKAVDWGLDEPSYSNGVAYADFDNDGDLDLVMNNINEEAFIYKNTSIEVQKPENKNSNFLRVKLIGANGNSHGLGAKITIFYEGKIQFEENKLQRGYKTTVDPIIHFGLGNVVKLDSISILWQSSKKQTLKNILANQEITLEEKNANNFVNHITPVPTMLSEVSKEVMLSYVFKEDDFVDFKTQRLLTLKHSQAGPSMAAGDVNGDLLEDIVIGAPAGKATRIFYQKPNGTFFLADSIQKQNEDMGVLLFDADNDNDLDLYCVSGSSEFGENDKMYLHRFYANNGKGKFQIEPNALPLIANCGSAVKASDFDKDGDLDLFVGGRISPNKYPLPPQSYLLQNNGHGKFNDATSLLAPQLQKIGMVTDALWSDFDNDGWTDLIVVGEFMPITFFKNEKGKNLSPLKPRSLTDFSGNGFWNSITAGDFDNDGDMDYVAGNLGLNSFLKASVKEPVTLYAKDYDQNGSVDPVMTHFSAGKEYPVHFRETLTDQMAFFKKKLTRYDIYGNATFSDLFDAAMLKDALILRATTFSSSFIENLGKGTFSFKSLPIEAQFAPIFGIVVTDLNEDGNLDLLAVGNSYSAEPLTGWYDAGIGVALLGNGKGNFTSVNVTKSGFFVNKDAKSLIEITRPKKTSLFVAAQNQDSLRVFQNQQIIQRKTVSVLPTEAFAEITLKGGRKRKQEFYFGNGYLSQSSRTMVIPSNAKKVTITANNNNSRIIF